MSCHPSHFEAPAPAGMSEEQIAKNWEGYNKSKGIDPRAIDKHFKFKPGHEVDYDEPSSGWKYVDVQFEGEDADPEDTRHFRVSDLYFQEVDEKSGEDIYTASIEEYSHVYCGECGDESDWTVCGKCVGKAPVSTKRSKR